MKALALYLAGVLSLGAPGDAPSLPPAGDAPSLLQHDDTGAAPSSLEHGDGGAFTTELERELWRAVVLLEGDVKTATRGLAACEAELAELAPPPPLPTIPPPAPELPPWVLGALVALAAAGGFVAGVVITR
jgi:hypothetical protein